MSVYVILDFDDELEAKEFVIDARYAPWKTRTNTVVDPTVAAVIKKATVFCHCVKREGWTRGRNFGWYVCASCGHPTEAYASIDSWASFMGANLLPPEISKEMRPKGWEHSPKEWTFLLAPKTPQGTEQTDKEI